MKRPVAILAACAISAACSACAGGASPASPPAIAGSGAGAAFTCADAKATTGWVSEDEETTEVRSHVQVIHRDHADQPGDVRSSTHTKKRTEIIGAKRKRVTYLVATETTWTSDGPVTTDLPYAGKSYVVEAQAGKKKVQGDSPPPELTREDNDAGPDPFLSACGHPLRVGAEVPGTGAYITRLFGSGNDVIVDRAAAHLVRVDGSSTGATGMIDIGISASRLIGTLVMTMDMKGTLAMSAQGEKGWKASLDATVHFLPGLELMSEGAVVKGEGSFHSEHTQRWIAPSPS